MHKMSFHFCRKLEEKKNNYYLVFGDKNYVFFSKMINIIDSCLLHRKTMLHSRNTKVTGLTKY